MADTSDTPLVVDKEKDEQSFFQKYASCIIVIVMIMVVMSVNHCKEGFASPDGVIARRPPQKQQRSDRIDKGWNLTEFEKSVALINKA